MKRFVFWSLATMVVLRLAYADAQDFSVASGTRSKFVHSCISWLEGNPWISPFDDCRQRALGFGTGIMDSGAEFEWVAWCAADGALVLILSRGLESTWGFFEDSLGGQWTAGDNEWGSYIVSLKSIPQICGGATVYEVKEALNSTMRIRFPSIKEMKVSSYLYHL